MRTRPAAAALQVGITPPPPPPRSLAFAKPLQDAVNVSLNARIQQKATLCVSAPKAEVLQRDAPCNVDVFVLFLAFFACP